MTYMIDENLFAGDALMMPDSGVGRCDFPGGSAEQLYDSVWGRLYSMPDHYQVFVGHDYKPGGRALAFQTSLREEKTNNIHLKLGTAKADFVSFRQGRDKTLTAPRLLAPSLDWNLGAHLVVKRE
jgi:glyoxylase-like metal-dependent hydrolase (beta-lactamase superfamily II)